MFTFFKKVLIAFCVEAFFVSTLGYAQADKLPFMNQSKIRLMIPAGERYFGELVLENPSDKPKKVRLYLEDWRYLPDATGAKEFLPAGSTFFSACPWIEFSPSEVVIPAFGKQRINYTVFVPAEASGVKFASLFFETVVKQDTALKEELSLGLEVNIRVATLFYVEVKGTVKRSARISSFEVVSLGKEGLEIKLDFENTGNSDITTEGSFYLMNKKGQVFARGSFNSLYTFPGGKGVLKGIWKEIVPPGEYDLVINIDLGKALQELGLGSGPLFIKEASVTIGENNQVVRVGILQ